MTEDRLVSDGVILFIGTVDVKEVGNSVGVIIDADEVVAVAVDDDEGLDFFLLVEFNGEELRCIFGLFRELDFKSLKNKLFS